MPIYLPPISRRRFLARTLASAAGLAWGPELFAATRKSDPHTWAIFSDTHLAANRSLVARGINMTDHFQAATHELLSLPKAPAGFLVCGDCGYNSGEAGDYAVLADLLQPIRAGGLPVHLLLGNHDHRERFWDALESEKTAKRPLAGKQAALVSAKRANWFLLDSLEATNSTPGLLGQDQLDWLARALDENRSKPAIVMVHHNPGVVGKIDGLKDTDALLDILRPRPQVKAWIFGHTHRWEVKQDQSGIHLINLPPVAYIFRKGDPAGWVIAQLARNGLKLQLRSLDPLHPAQGQTFDLKWRKS